MSQGNDNLAFHFKHPDLAHDFAFANALTVADPEPIPDLAVPVDPTPTDQEVNSPPMITKALSRLSVRLTAPLLLVIPVLIAADTLAELRVPR